MSVDQVFVQAYMKELEENLKTLPEKLQPDANQIKDIAEKGIEDLKNLVSKVGLTENDVAISKVGWLDDVNPLRRLAEGIENTVERNKKEVCVIGHMAIAAALLAAWVASGGTLTIGAVAAGGVTVNGPLLAALTGGASGRVLAEIMCS